ncbi:transcriptional regulator, TrmB [Thermoproteus uzoniensis 768-20]|uniref:Transcriptional regulator, TrmB n=1 Tax=Thermoproteus uzoniensis (strain 768-20) TaxID=999630 RepID=F2L3V7_THEU7|nr:MarR family transcriptional regulator [Thermoproteus uzoniensis]AEA13269.1 transcriptional regulator, TrmB [Thermoproteus uzoniensis 768-20]
MLGYLLLALELALLVFAMYTGRRRVLKALNNSSNGEDVEGPADVDEQIIKYLRSRGGLAYQGDIVKDLDLPKSTVHKAIRRLAERGLVEVRRQGRINIVTLREPAQQQPS